MNCRLLSGIFPIFFLISFDKIREQIRLDIRVQVKKFTVFCFEFTFLLFGACGRYLLKLSLVSIDITNLRTMNVLNISIYLFVSYLSNV